MIYELVNFISVTIMFLWALWCAFSPRINDGIFGKLLFATIAIAAFASILHSIQDGMMIKHQVTLHAALAIVAVRHFVLSTVWKQFKQKLNNHQR